MSTFGDSLTDVLRTAPELRVAPSLALAASQQSDPTGTAEALAHAGRLQATQKAYDDHVARHGSGPLHAALSWAGAALHGAEHAIGAPLNLLGNAVGAPLREVQHQYRYVRDVIDNHGTAAGLFEMLGMAGGAVGGGVLGAYAGDPVHGAILGAEAVGGALGRLAYRDSWDRTASGEKDRDAAGQVVSPGRDLARLLHLREHAWTSGVADGLFDLVADPVAVVGGGVAEARNGARALNDVNDVEKLLNHPVFGRAARRAFEQIAGLDAGQILTRYPKLEPIVKELGQANSVHAVADVFRDAVATERLTQSNLAPMLSWTRVPFAKLDDLESAHRGVGVVTDRVRRAFTLIPSAYDADLAKFSNEAFDPNNESGALGIYRTVRFGQSRRVAEDVAKRFTEASSLAERADIYRNAVMNTIAAKAGKAGYDEVASPAFLKQISAEVDALVKGPGREAIYALDREGHNISKVLTSTGSEISAAVTDNQIGKWSFPNYVAVKRVSAEVAGHRGLFGTADDFLYDHFTQAVFKKLVLLSGGFALRVAAAEAIPNTLRLGFTNVVKSAVEANVARLGVKAGEEESPLITRAVYNLLGRPTRAVAAADVDLYTALVQRHGGAITAPGVSAGENVSAEVLGAKESAARDLRKARATSPTREVLGDDYAKFGPEDERATDAWHAWLHEVAADPKSAAAATAYRTAKAAGASDTDAFDAGAKAASGWIRGQSPEHLRQFQRAGLAPSGFAGDPIDAWGHVAMENTLAATAEHPDLLDMVSEGRGPARVVTRKGPAVYPELDGIAMDARPKAIKGRLLVPEMSSTLDRIANVGFRRVLDPIINFLSREPIYAAEVKAQFAPFRKLVEDGTIEFDHALNIAEERAVHHMLPHIHNIGERSQAALTMRNVMPFYFAQTQAFRRVGRLLADDPGAFRRYHLIFSSMAEVGHHQNDATGQTYLTLPGTGFISTHVPGVLKSIGIPLIGSMPAGMSGDLKSLATVSPFLENEPGTGLGVGPVRAHFGPVVGIAAHLLMNFEPLSRLDPVIHQAIGERQASGSVWDQLVPNQTLKRVVQAFGSGNSRSFQNAMLSTVQQLEARGQAPAPDAGPLARQTFIDRVKNQARVLFILKAIVGMVSPTSPQLQIDDYGLSNEFSASVKKYGIAEGADRFLAAHPDATAYTVFKSKVVAGAPLPASATAQDFINAHSALFAKHPYAAAWLVPQDDRTFDQGVYNEQIAQHLRVHKAPDQMLNDTYVAAGYIKYDEAKKARDEALAAHTDKATQALIHSNFSQYLQNTLGPQNPVWWAEFQSPVRSQNRKLALSQLHDVFDSGVAPASEHASNIRDVLAAHDRYLQAHITGRTDRAAQAHNEQLKGAWNAYLDRLSTAQPSLKAIISSLFEEH